MSAAKALAAALDATYAALDRNVIRCVRCGNAHEQLVSEGSWKLCPDCQPRHDERDDPEDGDVGMLGTGSLAKTRRRL